MAAATDDASISSASIPYPSPPPPPPPPLPAQTASSQSPVVPVPSPASSLRPRVLSSAPARARVRRAEADSDGEGEGDWDGDVGAGGLVGEVPTAVPSTSPSTRSTSSPPTPSFLFGNSMPNSALARITENTKSSDGVVVISMANAPLGFGVAARGAQDGRKADTDTVVVLHQSDAGEYLRKEEELM